MQLQEIDTLQDLKLWVEENMAGARVTQDSAGDIVIHTGLISTMGGYLHEREGECDKCGDSYDLSSRDGRCGDCGNCGDCCTHKAGEGE
jgi:PHP family Zn ribbon phosphoesterase